MVIRLWRRKSPGQCVEETRSWWARQRAFRSTSIHQRTRELQSPAHAHRCDGFGGSTSWRIAQRSCPSTCSRYQDHPSSFVRPQGMQALVQFVFPLPADFVALCSFSYLRVLEHSYSAPACSPSPSLNLFSAAVAISLGVDLPGVSNYV